MTQAGAKNRQAAFGHRQAPECTPADLAESDHIQTVRYAVLMGITEASKAGKYADDEDMPGLREDVRLCVKESLLKEYYG